MRVEAEYKVILQVDRDRSLRLEHLYHVYSLGKAAEKAFIVGNERTSPY